MNPNIELDENGQVIWDYCDECKVMRPKGHTYHQEYGAWEEGLKRLATETTSGTRSITTILMQSIGGTMAKILKKKPTKASAATLTRRRNKMFGMEKRKLETQVEKLTKDLAEQKAKFDRQLEDIARTHTIAKEDWQRETKRLQEAENTLKKKFDDEKALAFKTMELEFKGKMQEEVNKVRNEAQEKIQKGIEENFNKLKDSLAKLHEEGNAQTKFTEQIALKMMDVIKPNGQSALITEK